MKVLHINSNYGYSVLHGQMVSGLDELNIENTVFFPMAKEAVLSDEKIGKSVAVSCYSKWDRISFYGKQKKVSRALEEHINVKEYDLLHGYTLFTDGNIAYEIHKKYGIPYVVAVRNTDVNVFMKYRKYLNSRGRAILQGAKAVFFLSHVYKKQVYNGLFSKKEQELLEDKTYVIPNGIGDFWLDNLCDREKELREKEWNLIFAGRINKSKNAIRTAMAAKELQKKGYKIRFTIVGKVEEEDAFKELQAFDFVQYVPQKNKEELLELYRKHDIFVMPSKAETFGLVYPEAMSQGLPVIYTRGQGFDGQFPEGEVGYSVDCESTEELAEKILEIGQDYTGICKRAIEGAKKFNWKDICLEYSKIYEKILK